MKFIQKQSEPENFKKWKEKTPMTFDHLNKEEFRRPIKSPLKKSLMQEQGYICCYCESRIIENDSHIEHIKPQNLFPELDLDYQNMLCSCIGNRIAGAPIHCGHLKDRWYDENLFVSPLDANCETRFKFKKDGSISSADKNDNAATQTINKLGLDIPKLNALRSAVINRFNSPDITNEELKKFVNDYLKKDVDQKWNPYWTTIRYLYKETVI